MAVEKLTKRRRQCLEEVRRCGMWPLGLRSAALGRVAHYLFDGGFVAIADDGLVLTEKGRAALDE